MADHASFKSFRARSGRDAVAKRARRHPHGYASLLGIESSDTPGLHARVKAGLPFTSLSRLARIMHLPMSSAARILAIPPRTLQRRRAAKRLDPTESDRLVRLSRVYSRAVDLFEGDGDAAMEWMSAPVVGLGGAVPLELCETEPGSLDVERLIGQLEHGVVLWVVTAWRIVKRSLARNAFSGEGALINGSRWSSRGVRVVYAAESVALAVIEILVHTSSLTPLRGFVLFELQIPDRLILDARPPSGVRDWRRSPAPLKLRAVGNEWAANRDSAVLRVPSAVVDRSFNFLINPLHPDFKRIRIGAASSLRVDTRLQPRRGKPS